MNKPVIIAIDGPAASGKGTLARELAEKLNYCYLPTGNIYRAAAKFLKDQNIDYQNEEISAEKMKDLKYEDLNFQNLNNDEIAKIASKIAAFKKVRNILSLIQKEYIFSSNKSIIVEGRDIGTVICPNADLKFYLTAKTEIRAKRRFKELQNKGFEVIYEEVLADLIDRDYNDQNREVSPLKRADDAIEIDSSNLSSEEVTSLCLSKIQQKIF
ncbi:MAG: (d)CMP kinase [Alphaproteobacteria bacterium]